MTSRTTNGLLGIILVAVTINLAMTAILIDRQSKAGGANERFHPEVARNWGDNVVDLYNRRDHEALYALFGPQAQVKIGQQQLADQLGKLHQLFGVVEDHAYVNAVKLGEKGGDRYFQLFFNARVSGRNSPATLKLSLIETNDKFSLYGLSINASESLD